MRFRSRWWVLSVLGLLGSSSMAHAQHDPLAFSSLGTLNVTSGTITINTNNLSWLSSGGNFTGVVLNQAGGMQVAVFDFTNITIGSGVTFDIQGSRALAFLSRGNVSIGSTLTIPKNPGANAQPAPGGYAGGNGDGIGAFFGSGPGGGSVLTTGSNWVGLGGGFGGAGGSANTGTFVSSGGASYGNLFQVLQGGSGGGQADVGSAGGGGGAIEISAIGSVSLTIVNALGSQTTSTGGGGGAGGGILLGGSSISYTSLNANGGNSGTFGTGGGGGRIAFGGIASYTLGTVVANTSVNGGNGSNTGVNGNGNAGVISVDALSTTVPSGFSITLNGNPITSIAGSTTQTGAAVEAYIRKDLQIDAGGTVTLAMDNALRRLNSSGSNITSLNVNGTLNTGAYSQVVSTLFGSGTINLNTGGSLTVGENNANSIFGGTITGKGALNLVGNSSIGIGGNLSNYTGPITIQGGGLVQFLSAGTTISVASAISGDGNISQTGNGTLVLSGVNTYAGTTSIQGGTLLLGSSRALSPSSLISITDATTATFDTQGYNVTAAGLNGGAAGGIVVVNGGNLTISPVTTTTFNGAVTGVGNLIKAGAGTQVLAGTNSWGGTTTVQQGTLQFNSPLTSAGGIVRVEGSGTLQANASITRPILGDGPGSTINVGASGITLGSATSFLGFNHQGILFVDSNTVTLASAGQPRLGSLTYLGNDANPGTLISSKGVYIDFANALTGYGTISSPNTFAQRSVINGYVQGTSGTQPITFTGWVKGVGTFTNVVFTGTFDPGFSPTLVTAGSLGFSATNNLIMELGGLTRGSQYDGIDATGNVNLSGALSITRINGFNPDVADAFVLINRTGGTGTFMGLSEGDTVTGTDGVLYVISYQGMNYMTNQLAPGANGFSVVIAAVPEPMTWALIGLGVAGSGAYGYRRYRSREATLNAEVEVVE